MKLNLFIKLIHYLLLTATSFSLYSQNHFEIIRDFENHRYYEEGRGILEIDNFLYITSKAISYEYPKLLISKYTANGDLIRDMLREEFQTTQNCINYVDDTLFITGLNIDGFHQSTIAADTSGNFLDFQVDCISDMYPGLTISSTVVYGDYLVTSRNSINSAETEVDVELCWINLKTGLIDTMIIEDFGFDDRIGDLQVDQDSLLTVVYLYRDSNINTDYYRKIQKFNLQKEKVWEWTSEKLDFYTQFDGFTLAILEDGRMVHTNGRVYRPQDVNGSLRAINLDGSLSWYYDLPIWEFPSEERFYQYQHYHLIRTRNNELVGCGTYQDADNKGYLFKLSSEGELLWERYYYTDSIVYYTELGNEARVNGGIFFDVEELENGDLAVVGTRQSHRKNEEDEWIREDDLWILRLNDEGCLEDYCGESRFTTIPIVDIVEENSSNKYRIYPNPVADIINIESLVPLSIQIFDINGKLIDKENISVGNNEIDISTLSSGIYYIQCIDEKGTSQSERIIKL